MKAVLEGSGMRSIGLAGAMAAFDAKSVRFSQVVCVSGGALIGALWAGGVRGSAYRDLIMQTDLSKLLDGGLSGLLRFYQTWGLSPGKTIETLISQVLGAKGVHTFGDTGHKLRIVVADITRNRLVVLPDDLPYYGLTPSDVTIAKAVRASIGVPFFFQPVKVKANGKTYYWVDGGILSGFPMFILGDDPENRDCVIGMKVGGYPKEVSISNGFEYATALLNTILTGRDVRDVEYDLAPKAYVLTVPSSGYRVLDFYLTDIQKQSQYDLGVDAVNKNFSRIVQKLGIDGILK